MATNEYTISKIELPNGDICNIKDTTYSAGTGIGISGTTISNAGVTGIKGNTESSYRTGNVNLTAANVGAVALTGDTMTGNLIAPSIRIANTYYGITFGRTISTPVETILHTGIKWASSHHMPVIHITGYAYGLHSPIEFKIGFYIYADKIGYCGVTNMGAWQPNVFLFKDTHDDHDYVGVGLAGSCYFLQLQADLQDEMGEFGYTDIDSSKWSWTFSTSTGVIPAADDGTTCVHVPYKANILNPSKVNGHTVEANVPSDAKFTDTTALTSMTGTLAIDHGGTGAITAAGARTNLELGTMATETATDYLKLSGGTMTGPLKWNGNNALPEKTNPEYFLVIDAFANGGETHWSGKAAVKSTLLDTNSTHNNQFLRKDGTWQTPPYPVTKVAGNTGDITADALRTSLGLSNAMHFLGVTTTNISTGTANTTATVTIGGSNVTAAAGDVVLYNSAEYVWGNEKWNLLGDESSYAIKATTLAGYGITDAKIANGVITLGNNTITPLTSQYTTHLYVNATAGGATSNATTANTTTYIHLYDTSTKRETIQLKGAGGATVTAESGIITITSANDDIKVKQTSIANNVNYKLLTTTSASPGSGSAAEAYYSANITANPSTGSISAQRHTLNLNGTDKAYMVWNNTDQSIDFIFE